MDPKRDSGKQSQREFLENKYLMLTVFSLLL